MAVTHVTDAQIRAVARAEGIDEHLFVALVHQESGGQAHVVSPAGAIGPTQLMPDTAKGLGVDPRDPIQNLHGGARYFKAQLQAFGGSVAKALAAYNAGPAAVQKYGGVPPFAETQQYVRNILGAAHQPLSAKSVPRAQQRGGAQAGGDSGQTVPGQVLMGGRVGGPSTVADRMANVQGLLDGKKDVLDFAMEQRTLDQADQAANQPVVLGATAPSGGSSGAGASPSPAGAGSGAPAAGSGHYRVGLFEGTKVRADWIPALRAARAAGWKGKVTSGVRTRQDQERLWAQRGSNPNPVARPGQSNHEIENGGAIDVSDPDGLERALQAFQGPKPRRDPSIHDPVHFSATGR